MAARNLPCRALLVVEEARALALRSMMGTKYMQITPVYSDGESKSRRYPGVPQVPETRGTNLGEFLYRYKFLVLRINAYLHVVPKTRVMSHVSRHENAMFYSVFIVLVLCSSYPVISVCLLPTWDG